MFIGFCYFCFIDDIGLCDHCIHKNNICINCFFSDHICYTCMRNGMDDGIDLIFDKNLIREWIRSNDLHYINLQEK
jgi:hypothetical protein